MDLMHFKIEEKGDGKTVLYLDEKELSFVESYEVIKNEFNEKAQLTLKMTVESP